MLKTELINVLPAGEVIIAATTFRDCLIVCTTDRVYHVSHDTWDLTELSFVVQTKEDEDETTTKR